MVDEILGRKGGGEEGYTNRENNENPNNTRMGRKSLKSEGYRRSRIKTGPKGGEKKDETKNVSTTPPKR